MENTKTPFGCTICKKEFSNPISLVKHVQWRHPLAQKTQRSKNLNLEDLVSSPGNRNDTQLCQLCYKHVNIEASTNDKSIEGQTNPKSLVPNDSVYMSKYPLQNFMSTLQIKKVSDQEIEYWMNKQCAVHLVSLISNDLFKRLVAKFPVF